MQIFNSLLTLSFVAVALVSAQTAGTPFDTNACSLCTLSSFANDATCTSLNSTDQGILQSVFANNTVSIANLLTAVKIPEVKNCLCHWSTGTFTSAGAAASCLTGATPACNATQVTMATTQMAPLSGVIHCDAVVSNSTGATPPASASPSGSASPNGSSGFEVSNLVGAAIIVATTAVSLGAMVGF